MKHFKSRVKTNSTCCVNVSSGSQLMLTLIQIKEIINQLNHNTRKEKHI